MAQVRLCLPCIISHVYRVFYHCSHVELPLGQSHDGLAMAVQLSACVYPSLRRGVACSNFRLGDVDIRTNYRVLYRTLALAPVLNLNLNYHGHYK